ncbi:branched-chain amino acid ABC transporter permease [Chelatococcus reniformis]|uniref:Branched-chain amino acid ABC transporter permease n=1 Tax=Chelatococcus reniformis TaxID=1494448 RepID=A0A916TWA9_9HYPH|nr:branched-chain amino acid ABC transporter permease [Chelatococcus reniformis]GGC46088.1 branched-chain amino acid ABC transporter permease [Chelatococcus reniformis]
MAGRFPNVATLLVVAALVVMPFVMHTTLATQIVIFATGTLSVTLLLGAVGLLSFGQGLFLGLGAYTCAILLRDHQAGPLTGLVVAMLAGAALALALGALIVRRRGVYFVMLTLAFAQMGYFAMLAFKGVTGGENGLTGLPRTFRVLGLPIESPLSFYVLTTVAFLIVFLLVQRLTASPLGSVLAAIRENEGRSEALGYPVVRYKLAAFTAAGAIAGLAGGLHAVFLGFVPPSDIELEMSQRLLIMAIIGGVGSPAGAFAGSVFYTLVSEALSEIWARWLALIALLLIAIVLFLPGGLWSIGRLVAGRWGGRAGHG